MSNTEYQDFKKKPQTNNLPACFMLFSLETNLVLTADLELAVTARSKHWLYYPVVSTQTKIYTHKFHTVKDYDKWKFCEWNACPHLC